MCIRDRVYTHGQVRVLFLEDADKVDEVTASRQVGACLLYTSVPFRILPFSIPLPLSLLLSLVLSSLQAVRVSIPACLLYTSILTVFRFLHLFSFLLKVFA